MRRLLLAVLAVATLAAAPGAALASGDGNGNHDTYAWFVGIPPSFGLPFPSTAMAAGKSGTVTMSGTGTLKAGPDNFANGGGTYSLVDTQGKPVGSAGTWSVTDLIEYTNNPYGCIGVICGGEAKLRVVLVGGPLAGEDGVLTIMCLVGQSPGGKDEGITLILGDGTNFPQPEEGATVFIK